MVDTRAKPRRSAHHVARIAVDKATVLDRVVRDYSEEGVRLEMANTDAVPAEFVLTLAGAAQPRLCRLVWRSATAVGARFVKTA